MITNKTKKELGKFLIDIAKLVLGGVVFVSVVKADNLPKTTVMAMALFTVLVFAICGFLFIQKSSK